MTKLLTCILADGIWLGNPRDEGERVAVDITPEELSRAENMGTTPEKLGIQLLFVLFTKEQLSKGNPTKPRKPGIQLLDQTKIKAIRGKSTCIIVLLITNH